MTDQQSSVEKCSQYPFSQYQKYSLCIIGLLISLLLTACDASVPTATPEQRPKAKITQTELPYTHEYHPATLYTGVHNRSPFRYYDQRPLAPAPEPAAPQQSISRTEENVITFIPEHYRLKGTIRFHSDRELSALLENSQGDIKKISVGDRIDDAEIIEITTGYILLRQTERYAASQKQVREYRIELAGRAYYDQ